MPDFSTVRLELDFATPEPLDLVIFLFILPVTTSPESKSPKQAILLQMEDIGFPSKGRKKYPSLGYIATLKAALPSPPWLSHTHAASRYAFFLAEAANLNF